jgi:lysine 2,3-aminomutase
MDPNALAPWEKIQEAIDWIREHPSIREVLITGGDPLTLEEGMLKKILDAVAANPRVDLIRIGSRTPVTVPMRITKELAALLGSYRILGQREICMITHVEHPYEITPEMVTAVDNLKRQGIGVFNQLVYTFFTSRRFESARLRMLLRRVGIDPYYTFVAKGKEETNQYRVPLARMLQEQKEEARLLPGIRRTDEVVYNVPRLGKNHARAYQHRDLIGILPDGSRVYEFHPWEKNIIQRENYIGSDVSILDYLQRLAAVGENPDDYNSIWYYF